MDLNRSYTQQIKKITILGAGTAGCISASFFKKNTQAEIEWIFDSGTPAQSVGEGSTLPLVKGLWSELNFRFTDLERMGGSIKKGIRKVGWSGPGDYIHEFPFGEHAMHFSSRMLQEWVPQQLKNRAVNVIDKKITSHNDIDADLIIDCSGRPKDFTDFHQAEYIALNAAHVVQSPCRGPLFDYTFCVARPFGWVFAIPLADRTSCGYLYNENINTLDEVMDDMKEFMEEFRFPYSDNQNNFSFKNYYRKENYTDRVVYNGNASFFLEPMEATSVGAVDRINRAVLDMLQHDVSLVSSNSWYIKDMKQTEHMIMLHYLKKGKYDTKFWDYARERAERSLDEAVTSTKFRDLISLSLKNYQQAEFDTLVGPEYGQWPAYSYLQNLKGLDIAREVDDKIRDFCEG